MLKKIMAYGIILLILVPSLLVGVITIVGLYQKSQEPPKTYLNLDRQEVRGTLGELETIDKNHEGMELEELISRFEKEPSNPTLGLALALRYLNEWEFERALDTTQLVIDSGQSLDDAYAVQGLVYCQRWRYPADELGESTNERDLRLALDSLSKALETNPKHREARCVSAFVQARLGNYDKGLEIVNQVLLNDDRLAIAYMYKGDIYWGTVSDPSYSVNEYKKAYYYNPSNYYPPARFAWVVFQKINYELCGQRDKNVDMPESRRDLINNSLRVCDSLLSESLAINPKYYPSLIMRAYCKEINGQYESAMRDLKNAYDIRPTLWGLYEMMSTCNLSCEPDGVRQYGEMLIQIAPENKDTYTMYANMLQLVAEYQASVEIADRGVAIAPDYSDLYVVRGISYKGLHEYAKAAADFERALELGTTTTPEHLRANIEYYRENGRMKHDHEK